MIYEKSEQAMKCAKLLCVSTLALALVGCSSNTTSSTATAVVTSGKYEVTNNTGAVVTELYFYDATSSEKGDEPIIRKSRRW